MRSCYHLNFDWTQFCLAGLSLDKKIYKLRTDSKKMQEKRRFRFCQFFFFFFFFSQGFFSYNLNFYTQNQSKLEKTLNRAITSLVRKDLKGIGPAQPITLSLPVGFSRGKESICQVFDIQRRDKSQNTRRFNSRITGRYRQLYIMYSFSHTFYRVYSEYSIFCRYMQHKVSTSHVIY